MTTRKPPAKGRTTKRTAAKKAAAKPSPANDTAPNDNVPTKTVTVTSKTIDGAPTGLVLEAVDLDQQAPVWMGFDGLQHQTDEIPLRAFLAANEAGSILPRDVIASWKEGTLNGLIAHAAEQCRAFEGVNAEALYLSLQMELRKPTYWPADQQAALSAQDAVAEPYAWAQLRDYADATPAQLAWVEVFARTLDFLDDLETRFPKAAKVDQAGSDASSKPETDAA